MKQWSIVLHFYQPPTQEPEIVKKIAESCYLPLLRMLNAKSRYGFTCNFAGTLLVQLKQLGIEEFFTLTKKLLSDGKIEIVGSAMYHPLIPLMPEDVITRQIKQNNDTLKRLLGIKNTSGFFPPELAMTNQSLKLINAKYILIDQTALAEKTLAKYDHRYLVINDHALCDLFRAYPKELTTEVVLNRINKTYRENDLIVTVNDAELFGHHYIERLKVLDNLLDDPTIKFITVSDAIERYGKRAKQVARIHASTWQDCTKFALWNRNKLQKMYLTFFMNIHKITTGKKNLNFLDMGSASCYLYWLSNWPWWHPGLVSRGAEQLSKCSHAEGMLAQYHDFLHHMWTYHRSGKVEKNYKKYDEKRKNQ